MKFSALTLVWALTLFGAAGRDELNRLAQGLHWQTALNCGGRRRRKRRHRS
jgi:hypothetical protein